jgi:hypothetical protein
MIALYRIVVERSHWCPQPELEVNLLQRRYWGCGHISAVQIQADCDDLMTAGIGRMFSLTYMKIIPNGISSFKKDAWRVAWCVLPLNGPIGPDRRAQHAGSTQSVGCS